MTAGAIASHYWHAQDVQHRGFTVGVVPVTHFDLRVTSFRMNRVLHRVFSPQYLLWITFRMSSPGHEPPNLESQLVFSSAHDETD